jgi:hypothetical protein
MNIKTRNDISNLVFKNLPDIETLRQFLDILETIERQFATQIAVKTVISGSIKYFTVIKNVAGALHNKTPSIRVPSSTTSLHNIDARYKFPFSGKRSGGATCIKICQETLPDIQSTMVEAIEVFLRSSNRKKHKSSFKQAPPSNPRYTKEVLSPPIVFAQKEHNESGEFFGNIVSTKQFIKDISDRCKTYGPYLPLRGRNPFPSWVTNLSFRNDNRKFYTNQKIVLRNTLFNNTSNGEGIYFFISSKTEQFPYYYIGISRKGAKYRVHERIKEHLLEKDWIFFCLANEKESKNYFYEVMRFYGDGGYPEKKDEYNRHFSALKKISEISSIAFISHPTLTHNDWEAIESYFVTTYQPPANYMKLNENLLSPVLIPYKPLYLEVKSELSKLIFQNDVNS